MLKERGIPGGGGGGGGIPVGSLSGEPGNESLSVLVPIHGLDFFFYWVTW